MAGRHASTEVSALTMEGFPTLLDAELAVGTLSTMIVAAVGPETAPGKYIFAGVAALQGLALVIRATRSEHPIDQA